METIEIIDHTQRPILVKKLINRLNLKPNEKSGGLVVLGEDKEYYDFSETIIRVFEEIDSALEKMGIKQVQKCKNCGKVLEVYDNPKSGYNLFDSFGTHIGYTMSGREVCCVDCYSGKVIKGVDDKK